MVCKEGRYYSLFGRRYSSDLLLIHEIQNEAEIPLNSSLQSGLLTGSFAGLDSRECVLQIVKKHTEKKKKSRKIVYMYNMENRKNLLTWQIYFPVRFSQGIFGNAKVDSKIIFVNIFNGQSQECTKLFGLRMHLIFISRANWGSITQPPIVDSLGIGFGFAMQRNISPNDGVF